MKWRWHVADALVALVLFWFSVVVLSRSVGGQPDVRDPDFVAFSLLAVYSATSPSDVVCLSLRS